MSGIAKMYSSLLSSHPIITKAVSSSLIGAAGDVAAQYLIRDHNQKFHIDWFRTFRIACMNFGYGFLSHYWYNALDGMVKATGMNGVLKKMLIDQLLFVPTCQILFYSGNSILEDPKNQPQATITKLKGCLWPSLRTNYTIWPLLQIINFKCVPLQYQVLYLSCGLFFWNIYLSHMANRKEKVKERVKEKEQISVNEMEKSSVNEMEKSSVNTIEQSSINKSVEESTKATTNYSVNENNKN